MKPYIIVKASTKHASHVFEKRLGFPVYTRNLCDACGEESDVTVTVGAQPDHESSTASLCPKCLDEAVAVLKAYNAEAQK